MMNSVILRNNECKCLPSFTHENKIILILWGEAMVRCVVTWGREEGREGRGEELTEQPTLDSFLFLSLPLSLLLAAFTQTNLSFFPLDCFFMYNLKAPPYEWEVYVREYVYYCNLGVFNCCRYRVAISKKLNHQIIFSAFKSTYYILLFFNILSLEKHYSCKIST